jgi:hypothetical protein
LQEWFLAVEDFPFLKQRKKERKKERKKDIEEEENWGTY